MMAFRGRNGEDMLKDAVYRIFFCRADRGPAFDDLLGRNAGAGFVEWDDDGGGIIKCASEKDWNEKWRAFVARHDYDEELAQMASEYAGD